MHKNQLKLSTDLFAMTGAHNLPEVTSCVQSPLN